jgi:hypothetical protein
MVEKGSTVKPVLSGHLWNKKECSFKIGDLFKAGSIHMKFAMTTRKRWPYNTDDCLIEVTAGTGLTVSDLLPTDSWFDMKQINFLLGYRNNQCIDIILILCLTEIFITMKM